MSEFFSSLGYSLVDPMNIVNSEGNTDLIVAGVQMFDGVIHQNKPIIEKSVKPKEQFSKGQIPKVKELVAREETVRVIRVPKARRGVRIHKPLPKSRAPVDGASKYWLIVYTFHVKDIPPIIICP